MKCNSCGAESRGRYCDYCGSEMPKQVEPVKAPTVINVTNHYYNQEPKIKYSSNNSTHSLSGRTAHRESKNSFNSQLKIQMSKLLLILLIIPIMIFLCNSMSFKETGSAAGTDINTKESSTIRISELEKVVLAMSPSATENEFVNKVQGLGLSYEFEKIDDINKYCIMDHTYGVKAYMLIARFENQGDSKGQLRYMNLFYSQVDDLLICNSDSFLGLEAGTYTYDSILEKDSFRKLETDHDILQYIWSN